jgi:hypothetical protein
LQHGRRRSELQPCTTSSEPRRDQRLHLLYGGVLSEQGPLNNEGGNERCN